MTVFVNCRAAMFGDMLCAALVAAGHEIGARFEDSDEITDLGSGNALIVHVTEVSGGAIRKIRQVRAMSPDSPIIILCSREIAPKVRETVGLDVDAVIPDDQHLDMVTSSLVLVEGGYKMYHPSQLNPKPSGSGSLHADSNSNPPSGGGRRRGRLSKRETVILASLQEGFSNKEIGNRLGIADTTVKVHLRSIYQKIAVKNRTQAAIWASEHTM